MPLAGRSRSRRALVHLSARILATDGAAHTREVGERLEEEVGERLREVGERLGGLGHYVVSNDDSILESGNHETKKMKAIIFWGGTAQRDAFYQQIRCVEDSETGEVEESYRAMPANVCYEQQLLEAKQLKRMFEAKRPARTPSTAQQKRKQLTSEWRLGHQQGEGGLAGTGGAAERERGGGGGSGTTAGASRWCMRVFA
jgi:hypothetical protein